jgi:ubiquinone/menaquinone biosynthesis C-methylase UbiE
MVSSAKPNVAAKVPLPNVDPRTVAGFGDEWTEYDQLSLSPAEQEAMFDRYFRIFPFDRLPKNAEGFDAGCGSGRWAELVLPRVGMLHCVDPSEPALAVARRRLNGLPGARFHLASAADMPLRDSSQDFGYSLGVLHHVPDTRLALEMCVRKLKRGAPFLLYLYYSLDNKPAWYRRTWLVSDQMRRLISRMPFVVRKNVTNVIAALIYFPAARFAKLVERAGGNVGNLPLSSYRNWSFYTMRTDALDRFGTRLERRFSRAEIAEMMASAGLSDIRFSETSPYWVACGIKS